MVVKGGYKVEFLTFEAKLALSLNFSVYTKSTVKESSENFSKLYSSNWNMPQDKNYGIQQ